MIPIEPEPLEQLRARYPAAIEPVYDILKVVQDGGARPGEMRRHVFDCEDGIRLVISRDRFPNGEVLVHFSASVDTRKISSVDVDFLQRAPARFREISGWTGAVHLVGVSTDKMIPNWVARPEAVS